MKIVTHPSYLYKNKGAADASAHRGGGSAQAAERSDRNSITRGSTTLPDKQMLTLKSAVQNYVYAPAGADYVNTLRDKIRDGEYHVSAAELAASIMLGD
jgi:anti-sigma28 factor (negative regulator of flagellin synthesis)